MAFETKRSEMSDRLLAWYDQHARDLPWRVGPAQRKAGRRPNAYKVWLSEIMLQQTTVATVSPRYSDFLDRWPSVSALASAPLDDVLGAWAGLGYYARARNLHKCAQVVAERYDGVFPDTEEALRALPGIGDYTAAAIAAIAFDKRAAAIDGNIERIVARLFTIGALPPKSKKQIKACAEDIWPSSRSGDFAQGLMDLGATICRPKNPACSCCPLLSSCKARKEGAVDQYPAKAQKKAKPNRTGSVYALFNGRGQVLLERRPEKGLLGGMLGLPGTDWREFRHAGREEETLSGATKIAWRDAGVVTHVFTHFHLTLSVRFADAPKGYRRDDDQTWSKADEAKVPTVMRKALDCAVSARTLVS
ncbi:MAG: A/G-specific adenine glycosylase [Pseudomonadota bacterium]